MNSSDRRNGAAPAAGSTTSRGDVATPGKRTLTEGLRLEAATPAMPLQARGELDGGGDVPAVAAAGVAGAGGALPFLGQIQASFGRHDVSGVAAHVGDGASAAAQAIGAEAYATGNHVAFGASPTLETTAHEAAHVVQQRGGVQLKGGVGEAGDAYEQHADAVASLVVQGKSAEGLLDQMAGGSASGGGAVQRKLNMAAGYTEALSWSSEAQALIAAYDKLVETIEGLEALRPRLTGRAFRNRRKQVGELRAFLTGLERQRIPNDRAVREQRTAEIEAQQARADGIRDAIHARLGIAAEAEDDELDGPDAENDVVDATVAEHAHEHTLDLAPPETAGPAPVSNATATGNATATSPAPAPAPTSNATATGNATAPADAGAEAAAEADPSQVVEAIQAIEFKIFDLEGGKLLDRSGRAGSASAEYGGGLKASGAEGAQGELKAEIKLLLGKSGEHTSKPLDLLALASGPRVQVRAKTEGMVGGKLEAGVAGSMNVSREGVEGSLKGSASAFLGGSIEIAPQVRFVDASGAPLATVTGIGGVSYGLGGSYEGSVSFQGWSIKFSSKGKVSAGLGVSWGMSGEIDAGAVSAKLYHAIFG